MADIKRKLPETLDFVEGLLIAADEISNALSGELEPRQVLAQSHTAIASFNTSQIEDLGKYQGRVVLVALAAELALKFVWESENQNRAATTSHDLLKLFRCLSPDLQEKTRNEYHRRVTNPPEQVWETVEQAFEICRNAFVDWRYIVEEGKYPRYVMRATFLKEATKSVIAVAI